MGKTVLIAPIGTEAQIVTTTIDLLSEKKDHVDEVSVLYSSGGDTLLVTAAELLNEELAKYTDLSFTVKPFSRNKKIIKDLDSSEEVDILFYCLYNEVRKQKNLGNTVCLLCSGGRKIIAAYAMLVAQMLFTWDDALLYLISKGDYLKTKKLHPVSPADHRETQLLKIPFLEWNAVLPSISGIRGIEDPNKAYDKIRDLQLEAKYQKACDFIEKHCTKAERRVLELVACHGMSNAQMASKLFISERTVETHMRALLRNAGFFFNDPDITRAQLIVLTQPYYQMKLKER